MSKRREIKKECGRCHQQKAINCFGICRARKDGRNHYCKPCILDIVHQHRDRKREMKRARIEVRTRAEERAIKDIQDFERKPNVISPILHTCLSKVRYAIRDGYKTRQEIKAATGLTSQQISDALAILMFEEETITLRRIEGEAYFFVRRVAA